MQLQVTHIPGRIGINTHWGEMSIRQPKADLQITTTPAKLNMHTEHVKIKIDQRQCFSESGLKNPFELTQDFAQRGIQAALEAIGSITAEGNRMANIKIKSDAIAEIAAGKALPPPADFNITFMPQSRPKIDVEGGISFNPQPGKVNINITPHTPEINVTPGWVEIYMLQKPYFHFEFVGKNVDLAV